MNCVWMYNVVFPTNTHLWTETVFKKGLLFLKERKCFQRKLHQLILGCFHQLGVYVQEKNEFLHCTTMLHFLQEYYVIWSETARASKMPCISFCVFFFRPVPSCRKYCISWDGCAFFYEVCFACLHVKKHFKRSDLSRKRVLLNRIRHTLRWKCLLKSLLLSTICLFEKKCYFDFYHPLK
jgi:hypothetical protein